MDAADALKRMLNISSPEGGGQSPTTPQSSAAIDFTHSECSHTLPLTGGHISVVASPSSAAAQRSTSSPNNLEVMTFSLYNTAPEVYSGRLVAMNDNYVAYGVKLRAGYGVRILHRHTSQRGMVRDHLTPLVDMAFMGDTSDVLATMDQTGHVIVSAVSSGDDASADLIVMRGCHIYDEDNQHVPPQNAFSSGALAWLSCDGHGRLLVGRNGSRAYVCDVSALREAVGEQPINISAGLFNGIRYVPNISNVTAVSPNSGGTVALAGADGTVSFIDKTSLDVVAMTTAANLGLDTVDHMSFLDENHVLICGNSNSHVVLYHLQQQRELQRLSFKAPGGGMPSLYVSVDASNQYMLLSDTHEATLYVVSFAGAAEKSFSQIREFNSTLPMLSFVCAAATVGETEDMSDNAEYNQMKQETRIVVFTAQSKAMQQLTLRFPPSSTNEKAEVATNAVDQSDSEEVDGVLQQTVTALTPGAFTHDGGDNTAVGRDNSGRDIDTVIHASGDGLELEQSMSATEGIPVLTPTNIRQQSNESTPRHSHTQTPTGTITPTPLPEQPVLPSLDAPGAQGRDRSTDHLVVASNSPPQVHVAATQDKAHAHTQQLQGVTQPIQKQSHGGNSPSQAHARAHEHVNAIANANAGAQPQIQILKRGEDAGQVTAAATHSPPPKSESIRVVEAASFEKQFGTFRTEMENSQRALLRLVKESTERNKKVVEEYNDRSLGAVLAAVDKHMSQMRRDLATERQQMVGEIHNSIVSATDRAVLNSITQTVMPQLVMQFEQITRDVAGQVFASKPVIDHITISAAKAMKPALAETFTTAMQEAMIPACEAATREMFRQVSSALTERTDTYIDVIRTQSQQFSVAGDVGKSLSNTESAVQQLTQRLGQVSETLDITTSQTANVLTAVQDSKTAVLMGLKAQQRTKASANVPDMLSRQSSSQSVVRSGYTTPTAIPIPQQASQHLTQQQQAQPQQIQQQLQHHQSQPQQQQQRQVRNDYGNSNAQPMMYQQPPPQQQRPPQHQQVLQQQQQQPPPQQRQSAAQPQSKPAPGETPEDLWAAINKLLLAEKYEGAFNKSLNAVHLPTLERLCTTLDMERILKSQPPVISQPVLLSLIQQLSTNLKTGTVMKLSVVRTALVSLDRNDKIVQQHRMGLLQQVSNSLKAFKAASPYHPAMSEVERLLQDTAYDRL